MLIEIEAHLEQQVQQSTWYHRLNLKLMLSLNLRSQMVKRRRVVPRDQLMGLLEQIEETTPSTMLMFSQARPSSELKLNLLCVLQVPLFCNLPSQILLAIPNRIKEITSRVSNKSISKKQMLAERSKTKMLA